MAGPTLTGAGWLVDEIDRQLVQYDAETQSLVSGDGNTIRSPLQSPVAIDPFEARLVENKSGTLTIPTYVPADDAVVHPSVLWIPGGWNGYPYWMAMTPYTSSDSQWENPSIVCSHDGLTWVVPAGLTNPIFPAAGGTDYNSDTVLFFLPNGAMCVLFRQILGTSAYLKYMTSTDGVNWTAAKISHQSVRATEDLTSPSIIWEPHNQQYRMYAHKSTASPYTIQTCTAATLDGPWSTRTDCTYVLPTGWTSVWHSEFKAIGNGTNLGLIMAGTNAGGAVYAATAKGTQILLGNSVITRSVNGLYKSSFVLYPDGKMGCWFGFLANPGLGVEYGTVAFDYSEYMRGKNAHLAALSTGTLPTLGQGITWDSFNRADGALGTPTSGTAWTVESGGVNISSNQAVGASAANNKVYIASGVSDVYIRAEFAQATNGTQWLTLRRSDAANFWRAQCSSGAVILQKIVAGAIGQAWSNTKTVSAGDTLEVIARGSNIKVFHNNVLCIDVSDAFNLTNTGHGYQTSNTTEKLDNFLLSRL